MALNMDLIERGVQPGEVLVTGTTCLGPCEQGPNVVVYPTGTWYSQVKDSDVAVILDEHIKKGQPAAQLNPDSVSYRPRPPFSSHAQNTGSDLLGLHGGHLQ
jgi:(2Fe-2S) ferredoxin